jgi:PAS domain S-box-containing protein
MKPMLKDKNHIQKLEEEISRLKEELIRKSASEQQWRYNFSLIQGLFDSASEAIFFIDRQYRLLTYNKAAALLISTNRQTEISPGLLISSFLDEQEKLLFERNVKQSLQGIRVSEEFKSKNNIWVKYTQFPVYNPDNSILGIVIIIQDITKTKEAEQQLLLSQFSIDNVSEAMLWVGADARILNVNKAACMLLGYTAEELKDKYIFDIDLAIAAYQWIRHWKELEEKKVMAFETILLTKDGREIPTLNYLNFLEFEGQQYSFVISKDLSEYKKAQEEIHQSEELYKEIVENAPEAIMLFDVEALKYVDCNSKTLNMLKTSKEQFLTMTLGDISPEVQPDGSPSKEKGRQYIQQAFEGQRPVFEWMFKNTEGNPVLCEARLSRLNWRGKILVRASAVDITERKLQESRLLESEHRYKALFERIPDAVYSLDKDGNFINGNAALAELAEIPLEKLLNTSFIPFVAPEDLDRTMYNFKRSWQGYNNAYEIDVITGTGNRRTIVVTTIPISIKGEVVSVYATAKDVTEIRNYTANIKKVVQLLHNIYESISDAFFSLDRNWNYIIVNKEYERISGLNRENIIGKNYWDVTPGAKGSAYSHYFYQAMEAQQPINYEIDWESTWYGVAVYPSENGLSVHIRDITASKQTEKKIKDSLHEKEILLAEIHHRVKNNLAVVSSLLQLQSYNVDDEKVRAALQESTNRIQSIALVHEKLYTSETFSNIPMKAYITDLVDQISQSYEVSTPIRVHIDVEQVELDITRSVPCGLILNELISNAYKHAFRGREEGDIWIKFVKEEGAYELCIKDNGRGLLDDFNHDSPHTLGIHLVKMLTEQLGGELETRSKAGVQTTIRFNGQKAIEEA